jgi:DNA-directed RNA polymerase sigma subunit (sigma70/sigma32)
VAIDASTTQSLPTASATGSTIRYPWGGRTREISSESEKLARRPPGASRWRREVVSLNQPAGETGVELGDALADADIDFAEGLEERSEKERIARALAVLPYESRRVIELRFGFNDGVEYSLRAVAQCIGSTIARVKSLEEDALAALAEAHGGAALAGAA